MKNNRYASRRQGELVKIWGETEEGHTRWSASCREHGALYVIQTEMMEPAYRVAVEHLLEHMTEITDELKAKTR